MSIEIESGLNLKINSFEYDEIKSRGERLTSIIVLTYNKLEYTKVCIESIRKFTNGNRYEIIVVDNKSTDGTIDWLKEQTDLRVIYNNENLGFPKGCNQGIEIAKGDNIMLLNNDVIVTPNWLYNLDKALWSNKDIGAVGAVSNSCSYYQQINTEYKSVEEMLCFANMYNKSDDNCWGYRTKLIGFCILIKRCVLNEVGVLDERFTPGNFEDDDISFRMICAGYKLLLCRDTFIHHFGSVSFGEKSSEYLKILIENETKFSEKWKFNPRYSNMIRFDLISKIEDDKTKQINVLEVGCGTGATLLEIKSTYKNADVYGIERDEYSSKTANNICKLIVGDIEELQLPYENGFFDYIILGDVLEQLNNPWKVLKNLEKYLKKNGCIVASITNIMHVSVLRELINGNFSYTNTGILDRTHLRFFTFLEIQKLFITNNYEICNTNIICTPLSEEDNVFINNMCNLYGEHLRKQYNTYQYIIKAAKANECEKDENAKVIELKDNIIKFDSKLDGEDSINNILKGNNTSDKEFKNHIKNLIEKGRTVLAEKLIGEYKEIENKDPEIYCMQGIILLTNEKIVEAYEAFKEGLKIDGRNIDLLFNLAYTSVLLGDIDLGIKFYNECLRLTNDGELIDEINNILDQLIPNIQSDRNTYIILGIDENDVIFEQINKEKNNVIRVIENNDLGYETKYEKDGIIIYEANSEKCNEVLEYLEKRNNNCIFICSDYKKINYISKFNKKEKSKVIYYTNDNLHLDEKDYLNNSINLYLEKEFCNVCDLIITNNISVYVAKKLVEKRGNVYLTFKENNTTFDLENILFKNNECEYEVNLRVELDNIVKYTNDKYLKALYLLAIESENINNCIGISRYIYEKYKTKEMYKIYFSLLLQNKQYAILISMALNSEFCDDIFKGELIYLNALENNDLIEFIGNIAIKNYNLADTTSDLNIEYKMATYNFDINKFEIAFDRYLNIINSDSSLINSPLINRNVGYIMYARGNDEYMRVYDIYKEMIKCLNNSEE